MQPTSAELPPVAAWLPFCETRLHDAHLAIEQTLLRLEERFVVLGRTLSSSVELIKRLNAEAEQRVQSICSDLDGPALAELRQHRDIALAQLERQIEVLRGRAEPLGAICTDLHGLPALASNIERIGAFLKACRYAFSLESARIPSGKQTFATFIGDLRGVSSTLTQLAWTVTDRASTTLPEVEHTLEATQEQVAELSILTTSTAESLGRAIEQIDALLKAAQHEYADLAQRKQRMAVSTESIIYHLQFGDMIRQKCEHVRDGIRDAQRCIADRTDIDRCCADLHAIVRTQLAQSDLIETELATACEQLREVCLAVSAELTPLAERCRGPDSDAATWRCLEECLAQLSRAHGHASEISQRARRGSSAAAEAISALQAELSGVARLSRQLHMLGLNALVQASQVASQHRTLGALAHQVDGVHHACHSVLAQLREVLERMAAQIAPILGSDEPLAPLTTNCVVRLRQARRASNQLLSHLGRVADEALIRLRQSVVNLSALSEFAADAAVIRGALSDVLRALPASSAIDATALGAALAERYTMASEREAHARVHEGTSTADAGAAAPQPEENSDSEFGDNVELF